ncbi:MAG: hypothetical protein JWP35_3631 [Caulobacter sp.]|nr:hypothetical protein [Caulobacter sp.]
MPPVKGSHHRALPAPELRPLTRRQRRFVEEYLVDMKPGAAWRRSGYEGENAGQLAYLAMKKPHVAAAIADGAARAMAERRAGLDLAEGRILNEITRLAFANIGEVARWGVGEDGKAFLAVIGPEKLGPDELAAVSEVTLSSAGLKVKVHDKLSALLALARLLGLPRAAPEQADRAVDLQALVARLYQVPEAARDQISALLREGR